MQTTPEQQRIAAEAARKDRDGKPAEKPTPPAPVPGPLAGSATKLETAKPPTPAAKP